MGFRSTLTMEDRGQQWPDWFWEKYPQFVRQPGPLACKHEFKLYCQEDLWSDIQKAQAELIHKHMPIHGPLRVVCLHECGGITVVDIHPERIVLADLKWDALEAREETWHHYCGPGCDPIRGED